MELCDGNLKDYIHRNKGLSEGEAKKWFSQLADALKAMRSVGLAHRDLKSENLLIKGGCLKLADFGLAKDLSEFGKRGTKCGTKDFWAPVTFSFLFS